MYAVIEDSGTQFRVSEGDVVEVDLRDLPEGAAQVEFPRVLLIGGETVKVGTPVVEGAKVVADVVNPDRKDAKVWSQDFRRRKHSRKKIGHRQRYLVVRIKQIVA